MTDFLEVDGIRLECRWIDGADAGLAPLVLLHEGLGCVYMWRDFPRRLAEATGHPVFVYSRQGYGHSDPKPSPWPVRYMHDEALLVLPRVLEAAGLDEVVLVGHSDGASIALIYAGGVPDPRAKSMVLMAPHVFNEPVCVTSIEQAKTAYETTDMRTRLSLYHGGNVDNAFWGWNGAWLHPEFLHWNIEEYLPAISVPVLVLQGEQDQYGTPRQVEAITSKTGGPRRSVLIPDCRHSPYLDQPDTVLKEIVSFLGQG